MTIKIAQQNLQHCKPATLIFIQHMEEHDINMAMVQEPYTTNNKIPGIPTGWKQIISKTNRAAIIIRTTAIPITQVSIAEDLVTISTPIEDNNMLLTSLYSSPSEEISTQLNDYEKAAQKHLYK
ncbi:hypothetical protein CEXT_272071 [Caerostris extrusa]|uniref:Uncharacterized protein n=1 Tax=Caerostris extrusa TaxID=172846 RepID=A0AAV4P212_CAEEX|nr:hypothetical protein CEXT_272071 [Caerostris extrusa]